MAADGQRDGSKQPAKASAMGQRDQFQAIGDSVNLYTDSRQHTPHSRYRVMHLCKPVPRMMSLNRCVSILSVIGFYC